MENKCIHLNNNNVNGFGTMPRISAKSTNNTNKNNNNNSPNNVVLMRRSSSVPCGQVSNQSDRGSTSSSDSGFSSGSRSPPGNQNKAWEDFTMQKTKF